MSQESCTRYAVRDEPCMTRLTTMAAMPEDGHLHTIHLQGGKTLARSALFFTTGCAQRSDLSSSLGCTRDEKGGIIASRRAEESSVHGVYVAGDASRDVLLVAAAIAEGAKAGVAINRAMMIEDGLC